MGNKREVYPEKGFGSFNMPLDCLDELAVQRSFVFLSENLNFESLQDELNERNLISEKETKDYIFNAPGKHFRGGKFIKLMIKKRRCKDFVACLHGTSKHSHICEKILEAKARQQLVQEGVPAFTVTDELLQRHFEILYTYLEPREIADEMFQVECISVSDHDIVTDSPKKYKRLRSLLEILKMKILHGPFLFILECLHCDIVVNTLKTDKQCIIPPSINAMWIQHNFTILQEELPDSDYATVIMKQVLDFSNISDIESCKGAFRQKSKLLKILLMKGQRACKVLLSTIKDVLKREDLILNMESKSKALMIRGKPVLIPSLTFLTTYFLKEHEDVLYKELEPIVVCDYLFEEGALNILEHDIITETKQRQKQIKRLIEKLTENKKDCFHFFLYILQKEEFETIRKEIENPPLAAEEESTPRLKWKLSQSVVKVQGDDVYNEPIEMRLTVYGRFGEHVEQILYEHIRSSDTDILGEVLSHGQMDISDVSQGSVVIRLRPVTDQAVQTLISAKENNKLLQMIFGILRTVNIAKIISETKSLQIRIQVIYDKSATSKQETGMGASVEKRVKVNRNVLLTQLDPMDLISALSKSKSFPESVIDSLRKAPSRYEKVNIISSFVENGGPDVVNEFSTVLKDLGHCDIVEVLDPSVLHNKAEGIRKKITSNYENILNEMQITLAKETLSKCIGNIGMIKDKISRCGNRKQRMSDFLRFILQDDHNVLEFEKMLKRNGLYELLLSEESVQEDHISNQDIEVTVVKDTFPTTSEGSLFDSVITLSYTEWEEGEDNFQLSSEEQIFDSTTALPNDDVFVCHSSHQSRIKRKKPTSKKKNKETKTGTKTEHCNMSKKEGLRIVLLGDTGEGKSATGNSILNEEVFKAACSGSSVTLTCSCKRSHVFDRDIQVVDTPGLFDTRRENKLTTLEIIKSIQMTYPGPHCFLLVTAIRRFTKEYNECVESLFQYFGNDVYRYFIIVFTKTDELERQRMTLDDFITTLPSNFKAIIEKCNYRYIALNNNAPGPDRCNQVKALFDMIDNIVAKNNGHYTNEMYKKFEEEMRRRDEEIRKEFERKREIDIPVRTRKIRTYMNRETEIEIERLKRSIKEREIEINKMEDVNRKIDSDMREMREMRRILNEKLYIEKDKEVGQLKEKMLETEFNQAAINPQKPQHQPTPLERSAKVILGIANTALDISKFLTKHEDDDDD